MARDGGVGVSCLACSRQKDARFTAVQTIDRPAVSVFFRVLFHAAAPASAPCTYIVKPFPRGRDVDVLPGE